MDCYRRLLCLALVLLTMAAGGHAQARKEKLDAVPWQYMETVKKLVEATSWHVANIRFGGSRGEQNRQSFLAGEATKELPLRAKGLDITDGSHTDMVTIAWSSAWGASNLNDNRRGDARRDQENIRRAVASLKTRGDFTDTWIDLYATFCWDFAWHAANSKEGDHDDARNDKERADAGYKKMGIEAEVQTVTFPPDSTEVISEKLDQTVGRILRVDNRGSDQQQTAKLTRTVTKSRTISVSKEVGFSFGYSRTITAGVLFVEASMTFSMEMSSKEMNGEESTATEEDSYEWPLVAGPRQCVVAVATVNEFEVEAPYITTIKIKGVTRTFRGVWKGLLFQGISMKVMENHPACGGTNRGK